MRKKIYGEEKTKTTLTLTQTARDWLEDQRVKLKAVSISDTIERMARENSTAG
ncbi:hypothetical protein [Brasilonema sp. UFV-L1]|uniref:hypothetical protein n=1 Tax=Brasilonema sp. UFV-L1 TaxID=2234130 RepID=UPI00145F449A|nr:hypothetical protein [Brasilonema sp. UFV-L1]